MIWDDRAVELLKKLWAEGLSASQIAGRLGDCSRNAVIGKVHRLGLSGRVTTSRAKRGRPIQVDHDQPLLSKDEAEKQAAERRRLFAEAVAKAAPPKPVSIEPAPAPKVLAVVPAMVREESVLPTAGVSLLDLKESMCRMPFGDPMEAGFHFCGAKKADGLPYCEKHARIVFQPIQRRRPTKSIDTSKLKLPGLEAEPV
jgi:GcrA cell cycle regulator